MFVNVAQLKFPIKKVTMPADKMKSGMSQLQPGTFRVFSHKNITASWWKSHTFHSILHDFQLRPVTPKMNDDPTYIYRVVCVSVISAFCYFEEHYSASLLIDVIQTHPLHDKKKKEKVSGF